MHELEEVLYVELHAVDRVRNIARRYVIELTPDLFGAIIVDTRWGRIGAASQHKRVAFDTIVAARRHVRAALLRRASTRRRIGVAYVLVSGELPPYAPPLPSSSVVSC